MPLEPVLVVEVLYDHLTTARRPRGRDVPDDALSRAVETLSAELCWFLATSLDGREAAARATGSVDPTSRRPKS